MNRKKLSGLGFPIFFLLPIFGFFLSLFDIRSKSSAFVYIAFAMLFGFAISFSNTSADSFRYAEAFARFDNTLDYNTILQMYHNGELRDVYRLLLFYFVSLFSSNPKVMYAFAGLFYGVISYSILRIFVKERGSKFDNYVIVLTLVFFTFSSLSNINGFRFHTGAILLFYAIYNVIIQKHWIWIIGVLITPFFHYGFVPIVPILVLYAFTDYLLYNKERVQPLLFYAFVVAYLASWILGTNAINLSFLSQTEVLSGAVGERIAYVNSEEVGELVENRAESSFFLSVQNYFNYAIKVYVFIVILYVRKLLNMNPGNKLLFNRLFAFVLFFYAVAFIISSIPSGGRFLSIAHMFLMLLLVKIYSIYEGEYLKRIILWAIPVFSFHILFINLMLPFLVLTPTFWYGNVFWIIFEGLDFILSY